MSKSAARINIVPEDLAKVLHAMPKPQYVDLGLVGFDYSAVIDKAQTLLPKGSKVKLEKEAALRLENPTMNRIMEIYNRYRGRTDATSLEFETPGIDLIRIGWFTTEESRHGEWEV